MFANQQNETTSIQPQERGRKEVETIFAKYVRLTREKLELSISDARGRYELGQGYSNPKPSQNWKVVAKAAENPKDRAQLDAEQVETWMKVGIKKVPVKMDGSKEDRQPSTALVSVLSNYLEALEFIADNPTSEQAVAFHEVAKFVAFPKAMPKDKDNIGLNYWEYNPTTDTYDAVALSEKKLAKAKADRKAAVEANKD